MIAQPRSAALRLAGTLATVAGLVVLILFRQAGTHSWHTIWAEDGPIFLTQAGSLRSLTTTYNGYVQLVPRVLALFAWHLPVSAWAGALAIGGALIVASLAVSLWWFAVDLIPSRTLRAILVLSVCLLPVLVSETLANGVNTVWTLVFVCFWALAFHPRSVRSAIPTALLCAVSALSTIAVAVYLPLAAWMWWQRRTDRWARLVPVVFGVAVLVQAGFAVTSSQPPRRASHVGDLLPTYGIRVFGSALYGEHVLSSHWTSSGVTLAWVASAIWLSALVVLLARSSGARRIFGLIALVYSALILFLAEWQRGTVNFRIDSSLWNPAGARFSGVAILLLMSATFVLVSGAHLSVRVERVIYALIALQFVTMVSLGYQLRNTRSGSQVWEAQVQAARATCHKIHPGTVAVQLSPPAPGWTIRLSCNRLG